VARTPGPLSLGDFQGPVQDKASEIAGIRSFFCPAMPQKIHGRITDSASTHPQILVKTPKKAPQAIHVLDRFHIMQKMSKAIDKVRAGESRQMKEDGYEEVLKHSRWCLLKRPANMTEKQTVKLSELLKYNLRSVRAYLLKEDFQRFWEYVSPGWAAKFLDQWCTRTMRSKLEPMKDIARTLRGHRELILNWFRAKGALSSGIVEGLNNKVKLTTRKSYGFRTYDAIETALYHHLGGLPEPEFTHKFW
jgi:transposase